MKKKLKAKQSKAKQSKAKQQSKKGFHLNSEGKLTPQDLFYPYKIHGRDYYKAFRAWEAEDISLIEGDLISAERKNKVGIVNHRTHNNSFYSSKNGVKIPFHQWFKSVVICRHKKQLKAMMTWRRNLIKWTKLYAPEFYNEKLVRDRNYDRNVNPERKLKYDRAYRKMVRNNKKEAICT